MLFPQWVMIYAYDSNGGQTKTEHGLDMGVEVKLENNLRGAFHPSEIEIMPSLILLHFRLFQKSKLHAISCTLLIFSYLFMGLLEMPGTALMPDRFLN